MTRPPLHAAARQGPVIACILTAIVLVVLDGTIANVALPSFARAFHAGPQDAIWVVTGYQMALVMSLLPAASLGESLGFARIFTAGAALFTLASGVCALAPNLPVLVAARFVQGLGGAGIMALTAALLRSAMPPEKLGAALGWNALAVALSAAAGPTIGASLLSVAPWPVLFAVNLPVGLLVLLAARRLPRQPGSHRRLDTASVALNAAGFAMLVVGVDRLAATPALAAALLAGASLSLTALVLRERKEATPLVPIDLLRIPTFRLSIGASVCCFTAQMAGTVALPFYLQHTLHQTTFMTGLLMTPWPLATALAGPIAGRLADRVSTGLLCAAGGSVFATGLFIMALLPLHGSVLRLLPCTVLCGLGFGFFQAPNNRNMLMAAPHARSGAAGGMLATARLAGQTSGAVLTALLFSVSHAGPAPLLAMGIGAGFAVAAGGLSLARGGVDRRRVVAR